MPELDTADVMIVGGGAAGISAGAAISPHVKVVVLEAEFGLGAHASGRSVAIWQRGYGSDPVRALTHLSREPLLETAATLDASVATPALYVGAQHEMAELEAQLASLRAFGVDAEFVGADRLAALAPGLSMSADGVSAGVVDRTPFAIDAAALLQAWAKMVKRNGGSVCLNARVKSLVRGSHRWRAQCEDGRVFEADIVVNAAGAWADDLACMAEVRPCGLSPYRRTIVELASDAELLNVAELAFVLAIAGDFYARTERGRILLSAAEEIPSDPCDAVPEPYDVAYALDRLEHYTTLRNQKVRTAWAGLRTFAPDRDPVVGFDAAVPRFFWLAGQGGYGWQTAPALAEICRHLICGRTWPDSYTALGLSPSHFSPDRFA